MKRNLLIAIALLVVVGAGVAVLAVSGRRAEWTTSSAPALAEFEKGLDAREKIYYDEARQHFSKAVELDPGFLIAKYFLMVSFDSPKDDANVSKLVDELGRADTSRLTERERFILRYAVAGHAKDTAAAEKVLADYAAKRPDDPFALEREASLATARQDWPEAHRILSHLVEVAPNRVLAYNQLGYLEMGQGRFAEAQKMFETYRYIAPDQANPHDSLGELFILLGRYPEAKKELDEALAIKPDFCASWSHLIRMALMQGSTAQARAVLARGGAVAACSATLNRTEPCQIAAWDRALAGDWEGVWQAQQASCAGVVSKDDPFQIWVALKTGRRAEADAIEKAARERLAQVPPTGAMRSFAEAAVAHVEGVRLLFDGDPAKAAERFRFADRSLSYRELSMGLLKLFNRFALAQALTASGARDEAATVLSEARAVNRDFVDRFVALASGPAPG